MIQTIEKRIPAPSDTAGASEPVGEGEIAPFNSLPPYKKAVIQIAGSLSNLVAGSIFMVAATMMIKGLGVIDATAAVVGLTRMVVYETFTVLIHCNVSGISGPVGAAAVTRDIMAKGLWPMVGFAGLLSFSMGVMNLMPVPGFDGWHICMAGIEAVQGKPLSGKFQAMAGAAGFAVVVALLVVVTYHDIIRAFG